MARREQVDQVMADRASGRFVAGQSGNPAGRPPKKQAEGALEAALAAIGRSAGDGLALNLARLLAGKGVSVPAGGALRDGETGWCRLIRLSPDSVLDELDRLPPAELEALAASLGNDGKPCPPWYPGHVPGGGRRRE